MKFKLMKTKTNEIIMKYTNCLFASIFSTCMRAFVHESNYYFCFVFICVLIWQQIRSDEWNRVGSYENLKKKNYFSLFSSLFFQLNWFPFFSSQHYYFIILCSSFWERNLWYNFFFLLDFCLGFVKLLFKQKIQKIQ